MTRLILLFSILCILSDISAQDKLLKTHQSKIAFVSKAPQETIKASTKKLSGIINLTSSNFSFRVNMNTFEGFNNPLQKEHFLENYMEVDKFPEAFFTGKIIEPITVAMNQKLRAKGLLTIHGLAHEVLIDVLIDYDGTKLSFKSSFDVLLSDYDINVPKIVSQKISSIINVEVSGMFL